MKLNENKTLTIISIIVFILNFSYMFYEDKKLLIFSTMGVLIVFFYSMFTVFIMLKEYGKIITIEADLDLIQLVLFFSSTIFTFILLILSLFK